MSAPVNARDQDEHWAATSDDESARRGRVAAEDLVAAVRRHLPEAAWHSVVDLGVGAGKASAPWREVGARVVGIDVSAAMLAAAARTDPRFHALLEHDLDDGLPESLVRHRDADLIVSCGALHLVRDLAATLAATRAVLVPGGLLAFTYVPHQTRDVGPHAHPHAAADVVGWLERAGFSVLEHRELDVAQADAAIRHALVVARDNRPPTPWPEALRWIDRTACVDRVRLRASLERQPFVPTVAPGAPALREQIAAGVSAPRTLAWPPLGPASARHDAHCDVLAILPHPDDESIYAGGTLAAWAQAGARIELVVATAGAGGRGGSDLAPRRAAELLAAATILGVQALACLAWDDGGKYHDAARTRPLLADDAIRHWGLVRAVGDVVREIRDRRPRLVLSLDPEIDPNLSLHAHHLALGRLVAIAFHLAADPAFAPELGAPWAAHEHRVMAPRQDAAHADRHAIDAAIKHAAVFAHRSQSFSTARLLAALDEPDSDVWEWCRTVQRRQTVTLPLVRVRRRTPPLSIQQWQRAQGETLAYHRPRTALVEILCRQAYRRAGDGAVWRSLDLLGRPDTVAVVTGQQVGLLGGPALTLSKALSAVAWANTLSERGIPAVPLFWMATQDHDLDEVRTVPRLGEPPLLLELPPDGASVGRRVIGDGITTLLLRWLSEMPRPPSASLHAALLEGHTEDASFAHAFARMLAHATRGTGLVILDPDDRAFAALGRGVVTRELLGPRRADAALAGARARLAAMGLVEVVPTGRDLLQLFWCDEHRVRRRLRAFGDGIAAGTRVLDRAELVACLELTPERFTPAALLRPVIQDAIVPTIAYVAGPTEARYLAQTDELHAWAGVPAPRVVPRGSLRLMDGGDLESLAIAGGPAALDACAAPESALGVAMLAASEREVHDRLRALAGMLVQMPNARDDATAMWCSVVALAGHCDTDRAWSAAAAHIEAALAHTGLGTRAYARAHRATAKLRRTMRRDARHRDPERTAAWRRVAETPVPSERRMSMAEALLRGGDELPGALAAGLAHDPSAQVIVQMPRRPRPVEIIAPPAWARGHYGVLALGGLGGSGRVAWDVARGLGECGHGIVMLAGGDPHWASEFGTSLRHVAVPAPHAPIAADDGWVAPLAAAIVQVALDHRLAALSVHYGVGLAEAAVTARDQLAQIGHRLRVCVTLHGSDVTVFGTQPAQRERLRDAVIAADEVTAVSQWLATQAHEILALPRRPQVVTNAVDTALFFPEPRPARVARQRASLCHASNFRSIKRPLDAIHVLARVLADGHDAELSMIGDGPLRDDAQALARALGVAGRTRFVGAIAPPALAGRLRSSDIVLVTSASESFSLVALEAMASGAVLVGTRCGGLEELLGAVPAWIDRLLAQPGDITGLASRVGALLGDPDRFAQARAAGLAVCNSGFAQHQQLTAYAALLRGDP